MCAADKEVFSSFAHAQISITNEIYQYLGEPETFLFCPTGKLLSQILNHRKGNSLLGGAASRAPPALCYQFARFLADSYSGGQSLDSSWTDSVVMKTAP